MNTLRNPSFIAKMGYPGVQVALFHGISTQAKVWAAGSQELPEVESYP